MKFIRLFRFTLLVIALALLALAALLVMLPYLATTFGVKIWSAFFLAAILAVAAVSAFLREAQEHGE